MSLFLRLLVSLSIALFSISGHAACTYEAAQTKMMEVMNMMQVYNRQKIDYEEAGEAPLEFSRMFDGFDERKNEIGIEFANVSEKNPNIQFEDSIDQSICDDYDQLFETYAPDGYTSAPIKMQQTSSSRAGCDTNSLWTRYGDLIQKQVQLSQAGKFSDAEDADMRRLSTHIGTESTTDIDNACTLLDEFEMKVNAKM